MLCDCLQALWKQVPARRRFESFTKLVDFLPWFLYVWKLFPHQPLILEPLLEIFRLQSKVKETAWKTRLIRSTDLVMYIRQALIDLSCVGPLFTTILGLVKDLSFKASDPDKEYLCHELQSVLLDQHTSMSLAAAEATSAIVWNWVAHPRLGRALVRQESIWRLLQHFGERFQPVTKDSIMIHRHVASIVGTMLTSCIASSSVQANADDGTLPPPIVLQQSWLVTRLLDTLQQETDSDLRRRCMRIVRCLVSEEWGRTFLVQGKQQTTANHAVDIPHESGDRNIELIQLLITVLSNANDDPDTRSQACQAITALLPWVTRDLWLQVAPALETILTQTIEHSDTTDKLLLAACHTLQVSISHRRIDQGAGSCLAAHSFSRNLFARIFSTLQCHVDDPQFHIRISSLFLLLASCGGDKNENHSRTAHEMSATMLQEPVLDALSILLTPVGPDYEKSRSNTVNIILTLLKNDRNKKLLAENEKLLTALVNFCLMNSGKQKDEVKQVILMLVPEL